MVTVFYRAHQAQAQPIAGRAAARLQPNKAIEHRLAVALRDSRAAVADLEDGAAALAQHGDPDLAPPSGAGAIFERVIEKIGKGMRLEMPVDPAKDARRTVEPHRKALLF